RAPGLAAVVSDPGIDAPVVESGLDPRRELEGSAGALDDPDDLAALLRSLVLGDREAVAQGGLAAVVAERRFEDQRRADVVATADARVLAAGLDRAMPTPLPVEE